MPKDRDVAEVGIVLDVGGRGDKSFNDGAYAGADSATKILDAEHPLHRAGRGIRSRSRPATARRRRNGSRHRRRLHLLRRPHQSREGIPEHVAFAGVDYALAIDKNGNVIPPPPNVAALKFREEEGSFLVGALAALVGKSKKVGFVGGMDIPLIHKFEAGYRAGVKQVCPDCR